MKKYFAVFAILCMIFTTAAGYVIDGDSVYIIDSQASLTVTPHTATTPTGIYSQEFTACNKTETDTVLYAAYIFDDPLISGKVEYFQEAISGWIEYELACLSDFNYILNEDADNNPHRAWCFETIDQNGTEAIAVLWEQEFKTGNISAKTIQYTSFGQISKKEWKDVTGSFQSNYQILNGRHFYPYIDGLNFQAQTCKTWRIKYDPGTDAGKWDLWLWASSEGWDCILTDTCQKTLKLDPWWDAGAVWGFKQKLTAHTDEILSGNITNDHAILVDVNADNTDFWANVENDGRSVRFIAANETTTYDYHFERFDAGADRMIAWVEVTDTFTSGAVTEFYMYYGNSDATDAQNENGTYPEDYNVVWHMAEATAQLDSTSYGWDLTKNNTVGTEDEAKIGYGLTFTNAGTMSNATLGDNSYSAHTLAFWFKPEGGHEAAAGHDYLINKENSASNYLNTLLHSDFGQMVFYNTTGGVALKLDSIQTSWNDEWYHAVLTFIAGSPGTMNIYINGSLDATTDDSTAIMGAGTGQDWYVGGDPLGTADYEGMIDEVKWFQGTVLTADEVSLMYASENITLIEFGAQEGAPNTAPVWSSIDLNTVFAKENGHIKVTGNGAADVDSDALTLLCGTSSNPTPDTNDFCTSFAIPSPYTTVECAGLGAAGDGNNTVYCRLYDLEDYSDNNTWDYVADNTVPSVGTLVLDGFLLSETGNFIDESGYFFALVTDSNGMVSCEYTIDGLVWTTADFDGSYCSSGTIVISDAASYSFNIRGFDIATNTGQGTDQNYTGKGVLTNPQDIEDAELINVSWGLVNSVLLGLAFLAGTILLIILSVIVLKTFFA